jgi:crossover junction endodeoxyribonuclease RuvC
LEVRGVSIIGIDPGIGGAVAILGESGSLLEVHDAPIFHDGPRGRKSLNAVLLSNIIANSNASIAFIEQVSARPMEGVSSSFSFGRSRGIVEGICATLDLPVSCVRNAGARRTG